jgi:hypothetical protein
MLCIEGDSIIKMFTHISARLERIEETQKVHSTLLRCIKISNNPHESDTPIDIRMPVAPEELDIIEEKLKDAAVMKQLVIIVLHYCDDFLFVSSYAAVGLCNYMVKQY